MAHWYYLVSNQYYRYRMRFSIPRPSQKMLPINQSNHFSDLGVRHFPSRSISRTVKNAAPLTAKAHPIVTCCAGVIGSPFQQSATTDA